MMVGMVVLVRVFLVAAVALEVLALTAVRF